MAFHFFLQAPGALRDAVIFLFFLEHPDRLADHIVKLVCRTDQIFDIIYVVILLTFPGFLQLSALCLKAVPGLFFPEAFYDVIQILVV